MTLLADAHPLVHINAALNALATVLLIVGLRQIRAGSERGHGRTMFAALGVSAVFLVSYLTYHAIAGSVKFTHPGLVRYVYYFVLLTHVLLAAAVPVLALWAAALGVKAVDWGGRGRSEQEKAAARQKHRRVVRWAWPIWMYVSVTGVIVYLMLYHLWPPTAVAG